MRRADHGFYMVLLVHAEAPGARSFCLGGTSSAGSLINPLVQALHLSQGT